MKLNVYILFLCITLISVKVTFCNSALHQSTCTQEHKELIKTLYTIGAIKLGNFLLKSGAHSPIYIDMRVLISHPALLRSVAEAIAHIVKDLDVDILCGVPYGAVPLATLVSSVTNIGMIMPRKEVKTHGTQQAIEGTCKAHDTCLVIEDIITSGMSILATIKIIEEHAIDVHDIIVLLDREQGGKDAVQAKGYRVHSLFTLSEILLVLLEEQIISYNQYAAIKKGTS